MRNLTQRQKQVIETWFALNKEKIKTQGGGTVNEWVDYAFFPVELFEKIEAIHNTEILSQEVSRYIQKLVGRD